MSARPGSWIVLLVLVLASSGCVKKSTYRGVVDELAQTRLDSDAALRAEREDRDRERNALQDELEALQADLAQTRFDLRRAEDRIATLNDQLDVESRSRDRVEAQLRTTGEEAELLRRRVNALAAVEAEVRSRNRIYEDMIGRFRSLIDAGQLSISIANGRMVLQLPQDVLFQSGSASLNREGTQALTQIGQVLAEIPDRKFQVEGHTDDVPISTQRFPSNWELAAGRSLAVVHLLLGQGLQPENLSGASYGEYQPVSENETAEGRRGNRRIEIVMLPNLNVLADLGSG